MLNEDDRERIRKEEIFRSEVRRYLDNLHSRSRLEKLVAFFNSAFGIWFLSTIAVGLITWAYSNYKAMNDQKIANSVSVEKLDIEISNRIAEFRRKITNAKKKIDLANAIAELDLQRVVFQEYKDRTINSLMWELSRKTEGEENSAVVNANEKLLALQDIKNQLENDGSSTRIDKMRQSINREYVYGAFNIRDWVVLGPAQQCAAEGAAPQRP